MTDHCFISYSTADALEFALKLADQLEGGQPFIDAWIDKRDIRPGPEWDEQLLQGIKTCKCLLFVLTRDSVAEGTGCKPEWTRALSYKKPVVLLRLHSGVEVPFRLEGRQWIDFSSNFEAGMAQLRQYAQRLGSPEGALDDLKQRLSDANRDLRRAKPGEEGRIRAEMDDLRAKIKRQEEIVRDPEAARKQTEANIQSGLARERQPEKPVGGKSATRFINPPPGVAPNYFQDRTSETKEVARFLRDDSQRLLTIVGRGGLGKTAMVCRLLKALESGALPDGLGDLKVEGIVYLSETGSHRVNFANLFSGLSGLLPAESAAALEALYRDPQTSPASKMRALLERFPDEKVLLLLDNLEPLIDVATFALGDAELDESLRAFLCGAHTGVKIILTTRIAPRGLNLCEPGRQRVLYMDAGLESPYAENILREMDADGKLGLKTAPDALLARAREHTRGYPRALEALFAILASDRYTTLEEILAAAGKALPENVIQSLVGEAFSRLDGEAQQVMQALAVYNRPVSPAAVDYLLQPRAPGINSAGTLNRLVTMQFARRESGRYYLHPVDREYAFGIIPVEDQEALSTKDTKNTKENLKPFLGSVRAAAAPAVAPYALRNTQYELRITQYELLQRAADYFAQARKPREEWKKLDDLAAQLAEFDLRCAAGDYDTAASVLDEIDFDYLHLWGHYRLLIELHLCVKDKIVDQNLRMDNLNGLGLAHYRTGKVKQSIDFHQQGLETAREAKDQNWEGAFLGNLGNAYAALGETRKAIEFYEQDLVIAREIGDRRGEGADLGNLGACYANLGDARKAIEFHEQALVIAREIGDRRSEGVDLGNIAIVKFNSGDSQGSLEYLEKALVIAKEIGDQAGECRHFGNIGEALLDLGKYDDAIKHHKQAQNLAKELEYVSVLQYNIVGESQTYLFQNDLIHARAAIEAALQYDVPDSNHNATALRGIIALRQGERAGAQAAFAQSIAQADEILAKTPDLYDALDAKGLAVCGLILAVGAGLRGKTDHLSGEGARQDVAHAGSERPAPTVGETEHLSGEGARQDVAHAGSERPAPTVGETDDLSGEGARQDVAHAGGGRGGSAWQDGLFVGEGARQDVIHPGGERPAPTVDEAVATFRAARKIASHAGVVKGVLRLFDELAKCDVEGVLVEARKAAEGGG
ncbi:MAG: toll/interleukin-1 receptor domain-containing protein [Anaerolineales bacterium]